MPVRFSTNRTIFNLALDMRAESIEIKLLVARGRQVRPAVGSQY